MACVRWRTTANYHVCWTQSRAKANRVVLPSSHWKNTCSGKLSTNLPMTTFKHCAYPAGRVSQDTFTSPSILLVLTILFPTHWRAGLRRLWTWVAICGRVTPCVSCRTRARPSIRHFPCQVTREESLDVLARDDLWPACDHLRLRGSEWHLTHRHDVCRYRVWWKTNQRKGTKHMLNET